jgi:hypothetical protein
VTIDLDRRKVIAAMNGKAVEASLQRPVDAISWVGYCVSTVDAEFSPIKIEAP